MTPEEQPQSIDNTPPTQQSSPIVTPGTPLGTQDTNFIQESSKKPGRGRHIGIIIGSILTIVLIVVIVGGVFLNPKLVATLVYDHTLATWTTLITALSVILLLLLSGQKLLLKLVAATVAITLFVSGFFWITPLLNSTNIPILTSAIRDKDSELTATQETSMFDFDVYDFPYIATLLSGASKISPQSSVNDSPEFKQQFYKGHPTEQDLFSSEEILSIGQRKATSKSLAEEICIGGTLSDDGFTCQIIGTNKSGGDIVRQKDGFSSTYATTIGRTLVVIEVQEEADASDNDIISLISSASPLDVSTIRFSKIEPL